MKLFEISGLSAVLSLTTVTLAKQQTHPLLAPREYLSDVSTTCAKLISSLKLPKTTVYTSTYLPANTNISLPSDASTATCAYGSILAPVDLCRVSMNVATSSKSAIYMEAWLPTNWTGRFLSTGNGGLAGCLQYGDFSYAASLGFATVGANGGKNGTSGEPFFNNSNTVTDFASRSVHTGVVIGKQITAGKLLAPFRITSLDYVLANSLKSVLWPRAQEILLFRLLNWRPTRLQICSILSRRLRRYCHWCSRSRLPAAYQLVCNFLYLFWRREFKFFHPTRRSLGSYSPRNSRSVRQYRWCS
jgi:hypothetical protein